MEPQTLIFLQNAGAAAIAILSVAVILMLVNPILQGDKMKKRLNSVLDERDNLRKSHLSGLQKKDTLRKDNKGALKNIVDNLSLEKLLEASDLRDKMAQAGLRGQRPIYVFYFFRMITPIILFVLASLYVLVMGAGEGLVQKCAIIFGASILGFFLPVLYLRNKAGKRLASIMPAFPDALDLLLICVESGMSIEMAFNKVSTEIASASIELAEEFSLTTAELSYLQSRRQAYENFSRRNNHSGIRSVATSLVQAERYGTPLGDSLRTMANENRQMRVSLAEKKAAALPAKLTVPMILFFLPVLFIVILTPAGITLKENLDFGGN